VQQHGGLVDPEIAHEAVRLNLPEAASARYESLTDREKQV
jgi:hypothetical protein